jgi:hypothetical protein
MGIVAAVTIVFINKFTSNLLVVTCFDGRVKALDDGKNKLPM